MAGVQCNLKVICLLKICCVTGQHLKVKGKQNMHTDNSESTHLCINCYMWFEEAYWHSRKVSGLLWAIVWWQRLDLTISSIWDVSSIKMGRKTTDAELHNIRNAIKEVFFRYMNIPTKWSKKRLYTFLTLLLVFLNL